MLLKKLAVLLSIVGIQNLALLGVHAEGTQVQISTTQITKEKLVEQEYQVPVTVYLYTDTPLTSGGFALTWDTNCSMHIAAMHLDEISIMRSGYYIWTSFQWDSLQTYHAKALTLTLTIPEDCEIGDFYAVTYQSTGFKTHYWLGESDVTDSVTWIDGGVEIVETLPLTLGDVNGDGEVNAGDASAVLVYASLLGAGADTSDYDSDWLTTADFNEDGEIDSSDSSAILLYASQIGVGQ